MGTPSTVLPVRVDHDPDHPFITDDDVIGCTGS